MSNPYEARGREQKARKLANALASCGCDSAMVPRLTELSWANAAKLAKVKLPSAETRALVAMELRNRESLDEMAKELA